MGCVVDVVGGGNGSIKRGHGERVRAIVYEPPLRSDPGIISKMQP